MALRSWSIHQTSWHQCRFLTKMVCAVKLKLFRGSKSIRTITSEKSCLRKPQDPRIVSNKNSTRTWNYEICWTSTFQVVLRLDAVNKKENQLTALSANFAATWQNWLTDYLIILSDIQNWLREALKHTSSWRKLACCGCILCNKNSLVLMITYLR